MADDDETLDPYELWMDRDGAPEDDDDLAAGYVPLTMTRAEQLRPRG